MRDLTKVCRGGGRHWPPGRALSSILATAELIVRATSFPWSAVRLTSCAAIILSFMPCLAFGDIIGSTGSINLDFSLPADLRAGMMESDDTIFVFPEELPHVELATAGKTVPINLSNIGLYNTFDGVADTFDDGYVRSYLLHADKQTGGAVTLAGGLTFYERILGVVANSVELNDSDDDVGVSGTLYPSGPMGSSRGLEGDGIDSVRWQYGSHEINVQMRVNNLTDAVDEIRVITQASGITYSVNVAGPTGMTQPSGGGEILTVGSTADPSPMFPRPPVTSALGPAAFELREGISDLGLMAPAGVVEMDALSYGFDFGNTLYFSVDSSTDGVDAGVASSNVYTEANNSEASADVFEYLGPAAATTPLLPMHLGNRQFLDENGSGGQLALGLNVADDVDAMDLNTTPKPFVDGRIYFSLDSAFGTNYGTAAEQTDPNDGKCFDEVMGASGCTGAHVFVHRSAVTTNGVYATPADLGLMDDDSDDLDGLALREVGTTAMERDDFDSSMDEIYFSVRRGSAIIGTLDSRLGWPIHEADILTIPASGESVPQIVIPAESLGLIVDRFAAGGGGSDDSRPDVSAISWGDSATAHGDMDGDSVASSDDVGLFVIALRSDDAYVDNFVPFSSAAYQGDISGDSYFDFDDIPWFEAVMFNQGILPGAGSLAAFIERLALDSSPEPSTALLAIVSMGCMIGVARLRLRQATAQVFRHHLVGKSVL